MVDFCESDKMIKISGKVDKSNIYNGFRNNIMICLLFNLFFHVYIYIYI